MTAHRPSDRPDLYPRHLPAHRVGDFLVVTLADRVDGVRETRPGVAIRCACGRYQTPGRENTTDALQVFNADHGTQTGATT